MRVPLTSRDFLDRGELVYGDRIGVVDEPQQPAPSLGELTYREVARRGRAVQAGFRRVKHWPKTLHAAAIGALSGFLPCGWLYLFVLAAAGTDSDGGIVDDPLVTDLVGRLQEREARVWRNYDGEIDVVAAADPFEVPAPATPGQQLELPAPVAVESDGTEKYRRMSVRERSRLRPQMLEAMGWRHVSLWTIEVFSDPVS